MNTQLYMLKNQKGFTLIESLLTLFILSIGMLGIAGMQLQGLKSGGLAMQQMAVVMKTQEIIERMRSNTITYMRGKDANIVSDMAAVQLALYNSGVGVDKACINGTFCTNAEMVAFDLFQWETDLKDVLPGTVNPSISVVGRTLTVAIDWQDKGTDYNYTVSSQL